MQQEAIDLRTSHGAANNVPCIMLAARVLVATEAHMLRRPDNRQQMMLAGTLYVALPGSAHPHEAVTEGLFDLLLRDLPGVQHVGTISEAYLKKIREAADFMQESGLLTSRDHVQILGYQELASKDEPSAAKTRVRALFEVTPVFSQCMARVAYAAVTSRRFVNDLYDFLCPASNGETSLYHRLRDQQTHASRRELRERFMAHGHQIEMIALQPLREGAKRIRRHLDDMAELHASPEVESRAVEIHRSEILSLLMRIRLAFEVETKLRLRLRARLSKPKSVQTCEPQSLGKNASQLLAALYASGVPGSVALEDARTILRSGRFRARPDLDVANLALSALVQELLPPSSSPSLPSSVPSPSTPPPDETEASANPALNAVP